MDSNYQRLNGVPCGKQNRIINHPFVTPKNKKVLFSSKLPDVQSTQETFNSLSSTVCLQLKYKHLLRLQPRTLVTTAGKDSTVFGFSFVANMFLVVYEVGSGCIYFLFVASNVKAVSISNCCLLFKNSYLSYNYFVEFIDSAKIHTNKILICKLNINQNQNFLQKIFFRPGAKIRRVCLRSELSEVL